MLKINSSGWGHSDPNAPRSRTALRRAIAATAVLSVAAAGIVVSGGGGASAATAPLAQSRGNFVDGALGNTPIQRQLVGLTDASAFAPGTQSQQNPLDVTALGSINVKLTNALKLSPNKPLLGITLGAVNQVAVAHNDGFSYGASGAVLNSGGLAAGADDAAFPNSASIDLTPAGIAGNSVTLPGADAAAALGGVTVTLGAVSAIAGTPTGVGKGSSTDYEIARLTITAGSPALGQLITSLTSTLTGTGGLVSALTKLLGPVLPSTCPLAGGKLTDITFDGVTISGTTGGLSIDLNAAIDALTNHKYNLNTLPANTDALDLLLKYIGSADGLAAGLQNVVNGLVSALQTQFQNCVPAQFKSAIAPLFALQTTLQTTLSSLVTGLTGPAGGPSLLAPLANVLKQLVDIGINVQPNGPAGPAGEAYTDKLTASANQTVAPVPGQTVVRAIELNVLGTAINVALANAAAGPSSAAPVTPTTTAPPSAPNTKIPTGVPAGGGSPDGSPSLPLALLAAGLMLASGGAVAFKLRGKHSA
ncbi:MAG: choice-of-anchor G family protein [Actinomycetota bacterium]|nr:choice-of-anchor G family protein [Actinomycetota bacterium]